MIDDGIIVAVEQEMARVKVGSSLACDACVSRAFCSGHKEKDGTILAFNPLHARPGDEVTVDIPEEVYNKAAIGLFGGLILAALAGLGLGSLASSLLHLPASEAGFIGLLLGLAAGGVALFRFFRRSSGRIKYPVISSVLNKGDVHA